MVSTLVHKTDCFDLLSVFRILGHNQRNPFAANSDAEIVRGMRFFAPKSPKNGLFARIGKAENQR